MNSLHYFQILASIPVGLKTKAPSEPRPAESSLEDDAYKGVKTARVYLYKYSFFIRIVKEWNNLPQYVVEAESFKLFKARLKSFLNM